jgi:hypothetical protein
MKLTRQHGHLAALALLFIAAYSLMNGNLLHMSAIKFAANPWYVGLVYYTCLLIVALASGLLLRRLPTWAAWLLGALWAVSMTVSDVSVVHLNVQRFEQSTAHWLWAEWGSLPAFLQAYWHSTLPVLLTNALWVILFAVSVQWPLPYLSQTRFKRATTALLGLVVLIASLGVILMKFNQYLPREWQFWIRGLELLATRDIQPAAPSLKPAAELVAVEKIVVLMDESVRYREYAQLVAPRLQAEQWVDFGETASISNCSAMSNALIRWGMRIKGDRLAGDPREYPSVWAYARQAGYQTVLIDGQVSGGVMQNYVSPNERKLIDQTHAWEQGLATDTLIAKHLSEQLRQPGKQLIWVNKRGAHIPYTRNLPPELAQGFSSRSAQYEAAIRYNGRQFFDALPLGADTRPYAIVYTSDHGQDLDKPIVHCNINPIDEEYSVPLAITSNQQSLMAQLSTAAKAWQNTRSQPQIMPSLLHWMGYDSKEVSAYYGENLWFKGKLPYAVSPRNSPEADGTVRIDHYERFPRR